MNKRSFVPYSPQRLSEDQMLARANEFLSQMDSRRSVREFSPEPVPRPLIELAIRAASTAPSGAHRQPWKFVAVSNRELKRRIREEAEQEEKRSYKERMPEDWLQALEPLGTDWRKPFLESAPWLVVVFAESYGLDPNGSKVKNYYVQESVGIACGFFIAAVHSMGLATLTHTPSPMGFLSQILERPANERPYILFPVGFPAPSAAVPNLERKAVEDISVWKE